MSTSYLEKILAECEMLENHYKKFVKLYDYDAKSEKFFSKYYHYKNDMEKEMRASIHPSNMSAERLEVAKKSLSSALRELTACIAEIEDLIKEAKKYDYNESLETQIEDEYENANWCGVYIDVLLELLGKSTLKAKKVQATHKNSIAKLENSVRRMF